MCKYTENINELKRRFSYCPNTGVFTWKDSPHFKCLNGRKTGTIDDFGHVVLSYNKRQFYAHVVAWMFVHDVKPLGEIDHINGIASDNRMINLRVVTRLENARNLLVHRERKTIGVTRLKSGKFKSYVLEGRKQIHVGIFPCEFQAQMAREMYQNEGWRKEKYKWYTKRPMET